MLGKEKRAMNDLFTQALVDSVVCWARLAPSVPTDFEFNESRFGHTQ